ncbi:MAG: hypothetical protein ACXWSD_19275 [Bdellovibrionota bacterium]
MSSYQAPQTEEGKLSHDLNNCLSLILGHSQLLSGLISDNPEAMKHLNVILQVAKRMANDLRARGFSGKD